MTSTIRNASLEDLHDLRELLNEDVDEALLTTIPGEQYMLVLDDDDGALAAAAHLTLENQRGHLRFLAVSDKHDGEGLEQRMIDVAESICEAFGAAHGLQTVTSHGHREIA